MRDNSSTSQCISFPNWIYSPINSPRPSILTRSRSPRKERLLPLAPLSPAKSQEDQKSPGLKPTPSPVTDPNHPMRISSSKSFASEDEPNPLNCPKSSSSRLSSREEHTLSRSKTRASLLPKSQEIKEENKKETRTTGTQYNSASIPNDRYWSVNEGPTEWLRANHQTRKKSKRSGQGVRAVHRVNKAVDRIEFAGQNPRHTDNIHSLTITIRFGSLRARLVMDSGNDAENLMQLEAANRMLRIQESDPKNEKFIFMGPQFTKPFYFQSAVTSEGKPTDLTCLKVVGCCYTNTTLLDDKEQSIFTDHNVMWLLVENLSEHAILCVQQLGPQAWNLLPNIFQINGRTVCTSPIPEFHHINLRSFCEKAWLEGPEPLSSLKYDTSDYL